MMRRSHILGLFLLFGLSLSASGCAFLRADRIHYTFDNAAPQSAACDDCWPAHAGSDMVAVALSGGGARASVFGAAAIEALAEKGLMDRVTHISSVSGGGFPATYYALKRPKPCTAASHAAAQATQTLCVSEDYAKFQKIMRQNYLRALTLRQIARPNRFSSPTRRLSSLQDALDHQFIDGTTFADLPDSPILLINGARYDDARRFVFSNAAIPEYPSNIEPFTEQTLRTASFSQAGCTRKVPKDFSVALAVAISAGFPPLLGPAAIQVQGNCRSGAAQYWHLGDGGILDNSGVETIVDYALRAENNGTPTERVVIFAFDAGRSTSKEAMMGTRNLRLWTSDPGRIVDIVGKRANAYRDVAQNYTYDQSGVRFTVINMRYTDAQLDQWPASCSNKAGGPEAINKQLAAIPTNFSITPCNADLMVMAARDVIERSLTDQRDALELAGLTW